MTINNYFTADEITPPWRITAIEVRGWRKSFYLAPQACRLLMLISLQPARSSNLYPRRKWGFKGLIGNG